MIDHTYDAIVVGAGGAGLRVIIVYIIHFRLLSVSLKLVLKLLVFQNCSQLDLTLLQLK